MADLPRGSCPDCGKDVALRRGELVREHEDRRRPGSGLKCSGSGQPNACDCASCSARRAAVELAELDREVD